MRQITPVYALPPLDVPQSPGGALRTAKASLDVAVPLE